MIGPPNCRSPGIVTVCGPKEKLSIFTSTLAAAGWSFATTRGIPANITNIAVITGTAKTNPAFLHVMLYLPFDASIVFHCLTIGEDQRYPSSGESTMARLRPLTT